MNWYNSPLGTGIHQSAILQLQGNGVINHKMNNNIVYGKKVNKLLDDMRHYDPKFYGEFSIEDYWAYYSVLLECFYIWQSYSYF